MNREKIIQTLKEHLHQMPVYGEHPSDYGKQYNKRMEYLADAIMEMDEAVAQNGRDTLWFDMFNERYPDEVAHILETLYPPISKGLTDKK